MNGVGEGQIIRGGRRCRKKRGENGKEKIKEQEEEEEKQKLKLCSKSKGNIFMIAGINDKGGPSSTILFIMQEIESSGFVTAA